MICVTSEKTYKWLRADGGHDIGRLMWANGCIVTTAGLKRQPDLRPNDEVQVKTACDGPTVFVEWGRLTEMEVRED